MVNTKEIMEKDAMYLAAVYKKKPIVIVEGSGAVVRDSDGKEYIDCLSGISVTNAGHSPERLVKAGSEQLKRLIHCSGLYYSIPQTLLAEKLAGVAPKHLRKSFFCNSGAEAVEGAVKLAKKYAASQGRSGSGLIALEGSFHGRLGLSLTLTGQAKYKKGFGNFANYPGIAHAPAPYCYRCPLSYPSCGMECARKVEDIIKYHTSGDVAALIAEPIMGEGGIIVPPDGYHTEVQKICRDHNILYIADEVQTGFGRCGVMFAHELFKIEPDLMTMAKGIGGGLPIGGVICTDEVAGCLESGDHFSTFGGNPVCCAVALENISLLLEEGLVENSKNLGRKVLSSLMELKEKYSIIGQARGRGLMIGLELVKDDQRKVPACDETQELAKFMMKHGVIVGTGGVLGNVIRIQPPLCINQDQATRVLEVIENGIKKL